MNENLVLIPKLLIFLVIIVEAQPANTSTDVRRTHPRDQSLQILTKHDQSGWRCNGIVCPKEITVSCKVTKHMSPSKNMDSIVVCMNENKKLICGASVSQRKQVHQILDIDEQGKIGYAEKDVIVTLEGTRIPKCPNN